MEKSQKINKKIYAIFFLELLIFVAAVVLVFIPLVKNIINKSNSIQEKKIDQRLMYDRLSEIEKSKIEYDRLSNNIQKLDVFLKSEEEVGFLKEIEEIAEKTGNEISIKIIEKEKNKKVDNSSSASSKEQEEMLEKISYKNYFIMQINLKGEYEGLVNFLHKLENVEHYMTIISFNSQKIKEKNEVNSIIINNEEKKELPQEKEVLSSLITVLIYKK